MTDRQLIETGIRLADELREALDDPKRNEWGGPWEHLGDAEKDVRLLLVTIEELVKERNAANQSKVREPDGYRIEGGRVIPTDR